MRKPWSKDGDLGGIRHNMNGFEILIVDATDATLYITQLIRTPWGRIWEVLHLADWGDAEDEQRWFVGRPEAQLGGLMSPGTTQLLPGSPSALLLTENSLHSEAAWYVLYSGDILEQDIKVQAFAATHDLRFPQIQNFWRGPSSTLIPLSFTPFLLFGATLALFFSDF